MFRTKTLCHDEDDDAVAEQEYQALFPSFSNVFCDIVDQKSLDDDNKTTISADTPVSTNQIEETVLLLVQNLLKKDFKSNAVNSQLFEERFHSIMNVIQKCPEMLSADLEVKLIPNLVSFIQSCIEKCDPVKNSDSDYNFYKHSNQSQSSHVKPMLHTVTKKIIELLESFPENPVLLQIIKVCTKLSSLSPTSPLSQLLTGLELLLTSCHEWEKNAHKGVSIQQEMDCVTNLIFSWRKLELSSLQGLLGDHLSNVRDQTIAKYMLHVVGIVMEKSNKYEEVVRSLIRFMEAASIGDFQSRLDILLAVTKLVNIIGTKTKVASVLRNLHIYYSELNLGVEKALSEQSKATETKMKEFIKIAKWKDTNYWSVQAIMDKTKKALHKILREYQSKVSMPANSYFQDKSSEIAHEHDSEQDNFVMSFPVKSTSTSTANVLSRDGKLLGKQS